jgi:hypothetical protein
MKRSFRKTERLWHLKTQISQRNTRQLGSACSNVYLDFNTMGIHQLELFLAVMDASSMTRAAEKFYLSPTAVSFQMRNLALELNSELFVRTGKKVNPTPAALRFAQHARNILKLTGQIKQEFDDDPTKDTRPFSFCHRRHNADPPAW